MTFLNILTLFNVGEIFVNFIAGLYTSVAKAYSLLMTFAAGGTNTSISDSISGFAKGAYTLVGIFMVFRLAISILSYLIDPEKMNDKQVGTSKLISRIVVSVVLLLSLNTLIFPRLRRVEEALLESDSIIFSIFPNPFDPNNSDDSYWNNMSNTAINNKLILENNSFNISSTIIPSVKAETTCTEEQIFEPNVPLVRIGDNEILKLVGCNYSNSETKELIKKVLGTYYYDSSLSDNPNFTTINYGMSSSLNSTMKIDYNLKSDYTMYTLPYCGEGTMFTKLGRKICLNNVFIEEVPTSKSNLEGTIQKVNFSLQENISDTDKVSATIYYYISSAKNKASISLYYSILYGDRYSSDIVTLTFNSKDAGGILTKGYSGKDTGKNGTPIYLNSDPIKASLSASAINVTSATFGNTCHYNAGLGTASEPSNYTLIYDVNNKDPHCASTFTMDEFGNLLFNKNKQASTFSNFVCGSISKSKTKECFDELIKTNLYQPVSGDIVAEKEGTKIECELSNECDECVESESDLNGYVCKDTTTSILNGLGFARSILSSFTDRPDVITGDVEEGKGKFMENSAANDALARMAEDKEIMFDWFLAIIAGIGVIVYMWILCIEVIVRNMKLVFLQIISPIPVICYMNPNDKILNSWFKQYMGTYLDLFVKLLAINAGFRFIPLVIEAVESNNGFTTFLIYCGGFLFIKAAPTFISKVFGLENMAGTFKDAAGLVKTGLAAGAGAAVGGIAGAASGFGKGGSFASVAGGLFGGATRGLTSGAKGKLFDGAKTQMGRNKAVKESALNGSTWGQRQLAKFGMDSASRTDRNLKDLEGKSKLYEGFNKYKDNVDNTAESSNYMKDLRAAKNADGNPRYSESQIKASRSSWIAAQISAKNDTTVQDSAGNVDNGKFKAKYGVDYEAGKAAAMSAEISKAEASRKGNESIGEIATSNIHDYGSLDTADKAIKNAKTEADVTIASAKSNDSYLAGDAARQGQKNEK